MSKRLIVGLVMLFGVTFLAPASSLGLEHSMKLVDEGQNPLVGWSCIIHVYTGIDQWEQFPGFTNAFGKWVVDVTPHSTATAWVWEVTDERWNPPDSGPVNYPQTSIILENGD